MAGGKVDPFVGRRAFEADDHAVFAGRDHETRQLIAMCTRHSAVLLHGPAGVGKTSLLRAGLAHSIAHQADVLVGSAAATSPFPEAALPDHNPFTLALLAHWSPGGSRTALSALSVTDFLHTRSAAHGWSDAPAATPVVAVIDQLEGLIEGNRQQRQLDEFLDDLVSAAESTPNLTLVLSVRSAYRGELKRLTRRLHLEKHASLHLRPLGRDAALDAMRCPAAAVGLTFAPGLAEAIVADLATRPERGPAFTPDGGIDPTQLQVVCERLQQLAPPGGSILATGTHDVRSSNDAALRAYCAEAIDEVAAEHNLVSLELRAELARRLVTGYGQRKVLGGEPVAGISRSVLRELENRHLLTQSRTDGESRYTLVNDRLAPVVRDLEKIGHADIVPDANAASHLKAALAMQSADQPELAESHAWRALQVAAESDLRLRADTYSLLGNLAFEGGRLQDAETCYRRAAELSDQVRDQAAVAKLLGAIGRLHAQQGRHQAAVEDLVSAVTRLPGDLVLHTELAKALRSVGQSQAAAAVFGTVLTIKPDFPEALAGRGEIQADRGNASAAVDDLRLLRQVRPSLSLLPELRAAYALALARNGMARTAMEEADAALAAAQDNGLIYLRAARVVAAAGGTPERAHDLLRRAAEARHPAATEAQLRETRQFLESAHFGVAEAYERPLPAVS